MGSKGGVETGPTWNEQQQEIGSEFAEWLKGRIGKGLEPYEGKRVAGMTPYEKAALGKLGQYMEGEPSSMFGNVEKSLIKLLSGEPSTQITPGTTQEFYKQSIEKPTKKAFYEEHLPSIEEQYIGPGTYWGGERAGASADAIMGLQDFLGGKKAEYAYKDEIARRQLAESGQQRMLGAVGPAQQYSEFMTELPLLQSDAGMRIGRLERTLEQRQLDFDYQDFIRTQPEMNPILQMAMQFLGMQTQYAMHQPPWWSYLIPDIAVGF